MYQFSLNNVPDAKEVSHEFEYKFWNFDNNLIEFAQYFHIHRFNSFRKTMGTVLMYLSILISSK
jgi:hypothetical protein